MKNGILLMSNALFRNNQQMNINLLVIRTSNLELLQKQYQILGFQFDYHKHGNGPYHYASENNGFVLEIYPLTKSITKADKSLRLGFDVINLKSKINTIKKSNWKIVSDLQETEWGLIAIVQDLDGRKIELKNK